MAPEATHHMMETALEWAILGIELVVAVLIILCVVLGLVEIGRSVLRSGGGANAPGAEPGLGEARSGKGIATARLNLAQRFVLALEFLIAADILKTILTPTLQDMALLGSIIAIRTVLSLSIAYELRRDDQLRVSKSLVPGQTQPDCQNPSKK